MRLLNLKTLNTLLKNIQRNKNNFYKTVSTFILTHNLC